MVAPPTEYYFCKSVYFIIHSFYVCLFVLPVFAGRSQCWQFGTWFWFSIFCRSVFFINFLRSWRTCAFWFPFAEWLKFVFGTLDLNDFFVLLCLGFLAFLTLFCYYFTLSFWQICMLYVSRETVFIALSFLG